MESLIRLKAHFAAMPLVLQWAAAASAILGVILSFLPFIPDSRFNIAGHELSQPQLWETRVALALLIVGPLMLLTGIGILTRRAWARPLLISLPPVQLLPFLVVHWLYGAPDPILSAPGYAFLSVFWAVAAWAYLFGVRRARDYFVATSV